FPDYVQNVRELYRELGVASALWTVREAQSFLGGVEPCKPVEYILEVAEGRILAYVDEWSWFAYVQNKPVHKRPPSMRHFDYSVTPKAYPSTSILLAVPIRPQEVKAQRWLRV